MKLKTIKTTAGKIVINTEQITYLQQGVFFFSRKPCVIINTPDMYFKVEGTLENVQLQLRD